MMWWIMTLVLWSITPVSHLLMLTCADLSDLSLAFSHSFFVGFRIGLFKMTVLALFNFGDL